MAGMPVVTGSGARTNPTIATPSTGPSSLGPGRFVPLFESEKDGIGLVKECHLILPIDSVLTLSVVLQGHRGTLHSMQFAGNFSPSRIFEYAIRQIEVRGGPLNPGRAGQGKSRDHFGDGDKNRGRAGRRPSLHRRRQPLVWQCPLSRLRVISGPTAAPSGRSAPGGEADGIGRKADARRRAGMPNWLRAGIVAA